MMLKNLARFQENWTNVELSGEYILSEKVHHELDKLQIHIEKGCLENIPTKAGTSRQESMHKSLRKSVEKRRVGVKVAVASIGTCLYRWNERRLAERIGSLVVPPITQYQGSIVFREDQEVFGTGVVQNNSIVDDLDDDPPEWNALETESNSSNSENEDSDDERHNDSERIREEDAYHRILEYALYLKSITKNMQTKCKAPTMKVNLAHFTGRSLFLFSSKKHDTRSDAEECSARLTSTVNAFGFDTMPMPGDGDCFFHCISESLTSVTEIKNVDLVAHLKSIGIRKEMGNGEKVTVLRNLLVEEFLGQNRPVYEPFLVSSTETLHIEAQKFKDPGYYDSELGNCVPLAMSNILQVPLVIFTSMENYPVTHVIPRTRVLTKVRIYLAYFHCGSGHYDLVVEQQVPDLISVDVAPRTNAIDLPGTTSLKLTTDIKRNQPGCSCGRGATGKARTNEFCKAYQSRCPCYRAIQGCTHQCSCRSCANPFGRTLNDNDVREPLPRKRAKQDFQLDVQQTDREYMERKAEEFIIPSFLEDEEFLFEALALYLLITKQDTSPNNIFSIYDKIQKFQTEIKAFELYLRPKSPAAISKKFEEVKAKLQVDKEFFKRQIQYNCFF